VLFRSIVYRAAIDLRKLGRISPTKLLEQVNRAASAALAAPVKRYTMWTRLRLRNMARSPGFRLSFDQVRIEGVASLPAKLRLQDYLLSGFGYIHPNELTGFGYLVLRAEARNENDAARKIFDACDTFFGLASLGWRDLSLWTERHAQAKIWMGPNQFFWEGSKFLGKERVWYNPHFDTEEWKRFPKDGSEFLKRLPYIRRSLKALETHPLRKIISSVAKLIHEGMASRDLSYRLLRYWSALETLYSEKGNRNVAYDKVIRRATFAQKDRELSIMKLEHLSKLRNDYVHSGDTEKEKNELTQYLREILAHQILYFLHHGSDFNDHDEIIEMADLPSDAGLLERRKKAIQRRENIIAHGRHHIE